MENDTWATYIERQNGSLCEGATIKEATFLDSDWGAPSTDRDKYYVRPILDTQHQSTSTLQSTTTNYRSDQGVPSTDRGKSIMESKSI